MATPAKGKRFVKKVKNPKTGRTRKVSYGQSGKAKDGKDRIRPGTSKEARDPNSPNNLSRKKWKCKGTKSMR